MKILQSWKRNTPDSVSGESITVKITYSSFNPGEIAELEKRLPRGYVMMDLDYAGAERSKNDAVAE